MSRVIQWGVRPPLPENPEDALARYLTRTCPRCDHTFSFLPESRRGAHKRTYCDECSQLPRAQKYNRPTGKRTRPCRGCGDVFETTGAENRREFCSVCRPSKKRPGDAGDGFPVGLSRGREGPNNNVFSIDFETAREHSAHEQLDDFYRYEETHVALDTESDLDFIRAKLREHGLIWAKSATQAPPEAMWPDPRFWLALKRAKPWQQLLAEQREKSRQQVKRNRENALLRLAPSERRLDASPAAEPTRTEAETPPEWRGRTAQVRYTQ